ncbi:MAG TPA: hypothetical protein VMV51_13990 [Gemmatimonadaceae bacterium]|nr:hypothetical protein [Gemmatimonadaceae bacterium]
MNTGNMNVHGARRWLVALVTACLVGLAAQRAMGQSTVGSRTAAGTPDAFIDSTQYKTIRVKPSETDNAIRTWDTTHAVFYDAKAKTNKILLFLAGTNGTPNHIPADFLKTALDQGYRVIALSYITAPGVSQVCVGRVLNTDVDCAAEFRERRIYGDNDFSRIADEPQDAIVPRLVHLLRWLASHDASGDWQQYLTPDQTKPRWTRIAVAGQSQGGGMAEFLGQHEVLARVISFSGGWDYSNSREKTMAGWYSRPAVTPLQNWYATYNVREAAAGQLRRICAALHIPDAHVFALDKPLLHAPPVGKRGNPYHPDGIHNPAYRATWITMLGNGAD